MFDLRAEPQIAKLPSSGEVPAFAELRMAEKMRNPTSMTVAGVLLAVLCGAACGRNSPPRPAESATVATRAAPTPPGPEPMSEPAQSSPPENAEAADCDGGPEDVSCRVWSSEQLETVKLPPSAEGLSIIFSAGIGPDGTPVETGTKNLHALPDLPRLKRLELVGDLGSVEGIERFGNVEELSITLHDAEDLTPITRLRKLKKLKFVAGPVPQLAPLTELRELELDGWFDPTGVAGSKIEKLTWITTGEEVSLEPIAGLASLRELHLEGTGIVSVAAVSKLTGLSELSLTTTAVTDFSPLHSLKKLKSLSISGTFPSQGGLRALKKALPSTKISVE